MPADNSSVDFSYVLDRIGEILEDQGQRIRGIYGFLEAQEKEKMKEADYQKKRVEGEYGHFYHLVENLNIYNDKIYGEPKKTDVTSITVSCRLVGNEDLFSVVTDMGAALPLGLHAGNSEAGFTNWYKPLSETELYKSIAQMENGPAAEPTGMVLNDRDGIGEVGNEVGEYANRDLPGYGIEPNIGVGSDGDLDFSIVSDGNVSGYFGGDSD